MYTGKDYQTAKKVYKYYSVVMGGDLCDDIDIAYFEWIDKQTDMMPEDGDKIRPIDELGEVVNNVDDTCINGYIRQGIPHALQLIYKILKNK